MELIIYPNFFFYYYIKKYKFNLYFLIHIIILILIIILFNFNNNLFNFLLLSFIYLSLLNININYKYEYIILYFFIFLGSIIVITSQNLFILYLGLEIQTFSSLILISSYKTNIKSLEAGLKYLILGAISSGLFLLGIIILLINGFSLEFYNILINNFNNNIFILSYLLIILSLFFKISLFPLHFWIPDIFEGSSWKVLGFISTLPKISIILIIINFNYTNIYILCGLLSILIGTFGAINQTKIKRLLAYSSISHFGFMILSLTLYSHISYTIINIYLIIYMLNFLIIIILLNYFRLSKLNYIIELNKIFINNNISSIFFIITILSISGLPPLAGFISKWLLIWFFISESSYFLVLIIIVFSCISMYYYIRILTLIYYIKIPKYFIWDNILIYKTTINNSYIICFIIFLSCFLIFNCKYLLLFFNTFYYLS